MSSQNLTLDEFLKGAKDLGLVMRPWIDFVKDPNHIAKPKVKTNNINEIGTAQESVIITSNKKDESEKTANKDPISELNVYCGKKYRDNKVPDFIFTQIGEQKFKCIAQLETKSGCGTAQSKKEAKKIAAKELLYNLTNNKIEDCVTSAEIKHVDSSKGANNNENSGSSNKGQIHCSEITTKNTDICNRIETSKNDSSTTSQTSPTINLASKHMNKVGKNNITSLFEYCTKTRREKPEENHCSKNGLFRYKMQIGDTIGEGESVRKKEAKDIASKILLKKLEEMDLRS